MRRIVAAVGLAASLLVLAGCWPVPGQNPSRTGHNALESGITPANAGQLAEAWTWGPSGMRVLDPVVSSGGVHVALDGCGVQTVDPATGAERWQVSFQLCDPAFTLVQQATPPFVVDDDRVLASAVWKRDSIPSDLWGMFTAALDVATGDELGRDETGMIDAIRDGTAAYVVPSVVTSGPFPPLQIDSFGPPTSARLGPIDDASQRRQLTIAVHPSGAALESVLPTLGEEMLFHAGTGVAATAPGGDTTVIRAVRAYSVAESRPGCDVTTGSTTFAVECPLWVTPVASAVTTSPVIDSVAATIYLGTEDGTVLALDAATGAVRWTASVGAAVTATPALADDTLFVPTSDGRLVALAAAGCAASPCPSLWEAGTGSRVGVQPAVAGGVVFTGSDDGSLHAFAAAGCGAASCSALWSAATGSAITGAPAVSGGRLFVGTDDGRLIAYAPAP